MFLNRPQEELNDLWKSFQTDLRRSRIAEALANTPTFNILNKCIIIHSRYMNVYNH